MRGPIYIAGPTASGKSALAIEIAERLGYEVVNIDLFRTRLATATKEQLREETVILRWNGND